ncbi:MAG: hypothetical protein D6768_00285 [Chloroflexi bacterium]|nr:MAG: hypothetical protein D6768_00285 [Chloroflexota bacterium]
MLTFLFTANASEKLLGALAVLSALVLFQLPGAATTDVQVTLYANAQWEGRVELELSPAVAGSMDAGDASVERYSQWAKQLKAAADASGGDFKYTETPHADGGKTIVGSGSGQGLDQLNNIFFEGKADISVSIVNQGEREISIFRGNLDPGAVTSVGGSDTVSISGRLILGSNADQEQLGRTAIWQNPVEIDVRLTENSGDPSGLISAAGQTPGFVPPIQPGQGGVSPAATDPTGFNVIRNGDFEIPFGAHEAVAPEWEAYDNGRAHFGWYEETWPEAVRSGERAQLMEIFLHDDPTVLDRVMAIHQTVDVVPNSEYALVLYAIMRSDANKESRNTDEVEMHWGIDPLGEGNYDNVTEWNLMPLTEQNRLGSVSGAFLDDEPLFYERITGTVRTADSSKITLFIRGLKKFPTQVELNMDIDDVMLVGPQPGVVQSTANPPAAEQPAADGSPAGEDAGLPNSGGILARPAAQGILVMGGLLLLVVTAAAAVGLLTHRKDA